MILFYSCNKSSNNAITKDYQLEVSINGTKYSWQNIGTFSFDNQNGCVSTKKYALTNLGQITTAQYSLDVLLKTYRLAADFTNQTGSHLIQPSSSLSTITTCNLDISIDLRDNNKSCTLQSTNLINNITSISLVEENSSFTLFRVQGNFSCNFKNSSNIVIPVSGIYTTQVQAYK